MRRGGPPNQGDFKCASCQFSVKYDEKSMRPRYLKKDISLLEEAYVMRDPFVDGGAGAIIIGSDCCVCKRSVCISSECSFYYGKRYCRKCALDNLDHFPEDIHRELLRNLKSQ